MPYSTDVYFTACGKIDQHNKVREECGVDKRFRTNDWAIHVNFSILSMIFVDSFLLYKACCGSSAKYTLQAFFEQLASQLIDLVVDTPKESTNEGTPKSNLHT